MNLDMVETILRMCGGLGLFLFGMKLMGDGLEMTAGAKLRTLIEKLTTNKYMGALVGLIVTAVIQSSSATTVMVVGFVNAGLMNLAEAVGVIMGANVGTTATGLIIAINLTQIAPIAVFLGVCLMSFSKKNNRKHFGQIIAGFGILFMGMDTMKNAMAPLAEAQLFKDMITSFSNPLVGVLVGLAFTAIIQSSSASLGVLQALGFAGAITLPSAVFVIYGQNIGTCVTALLSAIGTSKTAKRTAIVHLLFNVLGAAFFIVITLATPFTRWVEQMIPGNVVLQISVVHIIFNIITTAILLPLSNFLIKIAYYVVPGKDVEKEAVSLQYLDSRILSTPPIAVSQLFKEVERMGELAKKNFQYAMEAFLNNDESKIKLVYENEEILNFLNKSITEYLVKINGLDIEDNDRKSIGALFHVVNDLERVGDHSENICELAQIVIDGKANPSYLAVSEIKEMQSMVTGILEESIYMYSTRSTDKQLAQNINKTEDEIDERTRQLKDNHIERLNQGLCSAASGAVFMDLLTNLERIADHATNIAFSMSETKKARMLAQSGAPVAPQS